MVHIGSILLSVTDRVGDDPSVAHDAAAGLTHMTQGCYYIACNNSKPLLNPRLCNMSILSVKGADTCASLLCVFVAAQVAVYAWYMSHA